MTCPGPATARRPVGTAAQRKVVADRVWTWAALVDASSGAGGLSSGVSLSEGSLGARGACGSSGPGPSGGVGSRGSSGSGCGGSVSGASVSGSSGVFVGEGIGVGNVPSTHSGGIVEGSNVLGVSVGVGGVLASAVTSGDSEGDVGSEDPSAGADIRPATNAVAAPATIHTRTRRTPWTVRERARRNPAISSPSSPPTRQTVCGSDFPPQINTPSVTPKNCGWAIQDNHSPSEPSNRATGDRPTDIRITARDCHTTGNCTASRAGKHFHAVTCP